MSISNYDQVITGFSHALKSLSAVLEKSKAHAEMSKYDFNALLGSRLFPDMFALTRQIQLVTDFAKGAVARLAGVDGEGK